VIDLLEYNVNYVIKKSVTFNPSLTYHTIPSRELKPETKPKVDTKMINFNDPNFTILKKNLISYLSGNIQNDKLIWVNNIFDNIFSYSEFVKIASDNKQLILDMDNKVLIKVVLNPEED
jgi:hypothetical protein